MLDLLAPAWLAALAAIALPIAIHLVSRGRARRQPMGSVRLLRPGPTLRARTLKLRQPLLLALRVALLAAVALALATPRRWSEPRPAAGRWILVEPGIEIPAQGEVRLLAPGLPPVGSRAAAPATASPPIHLWSLLAEADRLAPPGVDFDVRAEPRAESLRGARPRLARKVVWRPPGSVPNRWIERAVASDAGVEVWIGEGDAEATRFERRSIGDPVAPPADGPLAAAGDGALALARGGGRQDDDKVLPVAGAPLRTAIFADPERRGDAGYLAAGLAAAASAAGLPFEAPAIRGSDAAEAAPLEPVDLLFWLAPGPVPEPLAAGVSAGGALVSDLDGRYEELDEEAPQPAAWGGGRVRLRRAAPALAGVPLWSTPAGRPLLSVEVDGGARRLRFGSRFHPRFCDWVLDPGFPRWLMSLLAERAGDRVASARGAGSEPRAHPAAEALPLRGPPSAAGRRLSVWPERLVWLVAAALFAGERVLATRRGA